MKQQGPKAELESFGLRPKRHFGQNFLADQHIAAEIAELATLAGATVIELGAGTGALTRPLLEGGAHVIAVERDRDLLPVLRDRFCAELSRGQLELLEADAKAISLPAIFGARPRPHVLAGNLPYQITGPLLELAVQQVACLDRVVFLVQLEVARRLCARPAGSDYGALTVFVDRAYSVERFRRVKRGAFYPQPGVDSAVVVLTSRSNVPAESPLFRGLVHAAFRQRRKTLGNAWQALPGANAEELRAAASRAGIDLTQRGETLSTSDFQAMERALSSPDLSLPGKEE